MINSISNVIDKGLNKIAPIKPLKFNLSDSDDDTHETYDSNNDSKAYDSSAAYGSSSSNKPKIMERKIRIGDNGNGLLRPVLKQLH